MINNILDNPTKIIDVFSEITYNITLQGKGAFTDYSGILILLMIIFLLGIITTKLQKLGDMVSGLLMLTILLFCIKTLQEFECIIIEHYAIMKIISLLALLLIIYTYILKDMELREKIIMEYTILIILALFGSITSMETTDLLIIFVSLEIQAFSFYTLVSLKNKLFSVEGGLKYFLIGAIASASVIFSAAFVFQDVGFMDTAIITDLLPIPLNLQLFILGSVLLILGLLFKVGAVPFHLWLPDAYQGAAFYVLIFIALFPKIAIMFLLYTINNILQEDNIIFLSSIMSGILGSILAASQTKLKRFLAYGIIFTNTYFLAILLLSGKHSFLGLLESMGLYLIVSLLIFITIYVIINKQTMLRYKSLRDFISLKKSNIFISITIALGFLSAAGIPPFLGFYQKYIGLFVLIEKIQTFLGIFLIAATIIPVYYYLRFSKLIYFLSQSKHILTINIQTINLTLLITCLFLLSCGIILM